MISAPAPTLPNVQLFYGPMIIGAFFNMILYGVLLMQTLTYYQVYRRDPKWMRLFIAFLFFVETANTSLNMAMMYQPLILEYGQEPVFFPIVFMTEPLCVVLVSMPIQLLYAWRIHRLTNSFWIPAIISVLAMASFAGGVWTAITIQILRQFSKKPLLHNPALLWFLGACVADILITVSLVIKLSQAKTGFSATSCMLDKIIRMTIQTGMITALFSILDVACFMILPASLIHIYSRCPSFDRLLYSQHYAVSKYPLDYLFFDILTDVDFVWDLSLSKLYCNCLMSTLNARERLHQQQHTMVLSLDSVLVTTAGPLGSVAHGDGGKDRQVPDFE
ncbi:hypothetical protein MSAN_00490600 [Mycena sanguinolenta]|uniref:DUF6534 domain-containing protein n=1 Tax=Mycena sanguinolenta TaxID=230812 RepID=A0A8H6ZAP6_9AGAR|nr:hypothetical protein MSAN_00490600 [Mycena sanguinolenta]